MCEPQTLDTSPLIVLPTVCELNFILLRLKNFWESTSIHSCSLPNCLKFNNLLKSKLKLISVRWYLHTTGYDPYTCGEPNKYFGAVAGDNKPRKHSTKGLEIQDKFSFILIFNLFILKHGFRLLLFDLYFWNHAWLISFI